MTTQRKIPSNCRQCRAAVAGLTPKNAFVRFKPSSSVDCVRTSASSQHSKGSLGTQLVALNNDVPRTF